MINSWLVSLERFVEENRTAHETMQNEFIFDLKIPEFFYLGNWTDTLNFFGWSTD